MYDYKKYGDSPTCLNDEFYIGNKSALVQGFGITDGQESNIDKKKLFEGELVTVSNKDCTEWVQANAAKYEQGNEYLPYGTGSTFKELPQGINGQILCSRGFLSEETGKINVSIFKNIVSSYKGMAIIKIL